ncbi:MAG: hypothetical protein ACREQV_04805 [Candidatus Binatia bacterium]
MGVLGHSYVSDEDMERIPAGLEREVLPFVTAHRQDAVSIFTTLTPGPDMILTEKALQILDRENVEHRLVIVRTLPPEAAIGDFLPNLERGGRWTTSMPALSSTPQEAAVQIQRKLDEFLRQQRAVVIAHLEPVALTMEDWQNPLMRNRAYQRANAYLVSRCDAIVAFYDPNRKQEESRTAEALKWARNIAPIPEEYLPFSRSKSPTLREIILLP